jgi:hypothetical protein
MWIYRPTHTKRKSPKLPPSWEGLYGVVTRINNVVYMILWHPRTKMTVVYLARLAPNQGATWDEQPWRGSSWRTAMRPNPRGRKLGHCQNRKKRCCTNPYNYCEQARSYWAGAICHIWFIPESVVLKIEILVLISTEQLRRLMTNHWCNFVA